jgi:predicted metalloprotease
MQADCYVGVWTYFLQKRALADSGEIESGSAAAVMIVGPQGYTERLRWFKEGLATGDVRSCGVSAQPKSSAQR